MRYSRRVFGLVLVLAATWPAAGPARDVFQERSNVSAPRARAIPALDMLTDSGVLRVPSRAAAGMDTTVLGSWDFDAGGVCDPQGWVSVDRTAQRGDYFHVDDFAGLGGGDSGRLVPIEGSQSLWCGARPDAGDPFVCAYATLPGYGNSWDQAFCTAACLDVTGNVALDFLVTWDSEPSYDYGYVEYDACDDDWQQLHAYHGVGGGFASHVVPAAAHSGSLRFRFHFVSDGGFSDEDGSWPTDGAIVIDSLTVRDASGVVLATELFEVESVGDIDAASGNWASCTMPGYGDFAGLYSGGGVVQESDCGYNATCFWAFYNGSTYDYSCGGYPGQAVVPYGNARDQYIRGEIWSPYIALAGGPDVELAYDVYDDLAMNALVFHVWYVRSIAGGCPGPWRDANLCCYPPANDWVRVRRDIGGLIDGGATQIQVAVGVVDMCGIWGGVYGDCQCHSHAPLYDNVSVYSLAQDGPSWQVRDQDLFQDNFSADGTLTGTARADAAADILPSSSAGILPGDSVSVTVYDRAVGLDHHTTGVPASGPAVYCFVSVDGPHGSVTGAPLVDDPRYAAVGTQVIGSRTWTQIQMDSTWTAGGTLVEDDYNVDLNDNLFVPGDTVWFFFGARSAPPSSRWTYFSLDAPTTTGETDDVAEAATWPDEFTILPAAGLQTGGELLYVDGMNFRGAQPFFDWSWRMLDYSQAVDRFDIRGPASAVGNHPASRVVDAFQQLIPVYPLIVWNTGDLWTAFSDGSGTPDKSDDTGLLFTFLDNIWFGGGGGVYLSGDNVADEWLNTFTGVSATGLRTTFMQFDVVSGDHAPLVGVSPLVVGEPFGIFSDLTGPDTLVAYGGCPLINDFDVLEPVGMAQLQMSYHGKGTTAGAVVNQRTMNGQGQNVGFMLSGFSYHYLRDSRPEGVPARAWHLKRALRSMGEGPMAPPTDARPSSAAVNSLGQNHPNPFNPTTTIEYSIAERGHVSLDVYNVAGQLVRTLVDEVRTPETVRPVVWDGRNDAGQPVSSGVYFYRLTTKGFTKTRKMVVLK